MSVPPGDCADGLKNELAAEAIRSFGALRLRVTGSSMLPAIWPGDVLRVQRCRIDDAVPGEVVLFARHRRLFAHRVVARTGAGLVTRGDGLAVPDAAVSAAELLGKVTEVLRRGKAIPTGSKPSLSARIAASLVRRSAPAGRLLMRLHDVGTRAVS